MSDSILKFYSSLPEESISADNQGNTADYLPTDASNPNIRDVSSNEEGNAPRLILMIKSKGYLFEMIHFQRKF